MSESTTERTFKGEKNCLTPSLSPSSLGLRRHRQRCDDTAIGAAAAAISRATHNTTHTEGGRGDKWRLDSRSAGGSLPTNATSDTICESRSLARVAVVVTLFLVIATQQKQAESSRGTGEIADSTGSTCKSSIHSLIVLL